MTYETLIFGIENGVARITINRPAQLNAIDVQTAKELELAANRCRDDSAVRCVVLTGAGKAGIGITSQDGSVIDGLTYDNITMSNCACPIPANSKLARNSCSLARSASSARFR